MNISWQFSEGNKSIFASGRTKKKKASFEILVEKYYESLYHFALSLCQKEAEASDLTQQTFYLWACKGHQLRDFSKARTWLFTTLHRVFLNLRRREIRFPHCEINDIDPELPVVASNIVNQMDGATIMQALMQIQELCRTPLILFYLRNHSYREISEILDVPIGTVMSRLARGKQQLRQILVEKNIFLLSKMWREKTSASV